MKRIKRKRLKEDEFVSTLTKIINFTKKRTKEMITGLVAVAVIILAIIIVKAIQAGSIKKDSRLLANIFEISDELKDNPEKITELEKLSGNGKFARVAYIKLADYWFGQGDVEKSLEFLGKLPDKKKDLIYYQAQNLAAQIHIHKKEYDKAIDIYNRIEEESPKLFSLDIVLFHKAQAYEEKGKIEMALELYRRLKNDYSQTYFGFDASRKVEELESQK